MDKVIPTNGTSAEDIKYANTVKKVYIDGVGVSECPNFKTGICSKRLCELNVNEKCIYKQLQRVKTKKEKLIDQNFKIAQKYTKLEQENERLKEEKSKLLSKCLDKQCRINELINIVSTKEFTLKVNGKKYEGLNGIDKAKLFINNENAVRDKYIQKLENQISALQWKFYDNCKEVVDAQKQIDKYRQTLQEIREIAKEGSKSVFADEDCDKILDKINEVIGAE